MAGTGTIDTPLLTRIERSQNAAVGSSSTSSFVKSTSSLLKSFSGSFLKPKDPESRGKVVGAMVLSVDSLSELMDSRSKEKLHNEYGDVEGLATGLGSNLTRGLSGADDVQRAVKYGSNSLERAPPPTYLELFLEAMQDTTVLILLVAALISISLGVLVCVAHLGSSCPRKPLWEGPVDLGLAGESTDEDACLSWLDGTAIIMACLLIGNITAWNESHKEAQFRALQAKQDDCDVTVIRNGGEVRVLSGDVMVGDLVVLDTGAKVPADGVLVSGNDLRIDESALTGESDTVKKSADKPFLLSGTNVTDGNGKFLVLAVGAQSEWGKILVELSGERDETPLQGKLTVLAEDIGKAGTAVAAVCFVGQILIWLLNNSRKTCFFAAGGKPLPREDCENGYPGMDDEAACTKAGHLWLTTYENFSPIHCRDIVGFFIDSVTIIVVAVPEGLPLAVTIALAFSVKKMQTDKNLVRVMSACETMGGCTTICSDKTGTLTQNTMAVTDGYIAGRMFDGKLPSKDDGQLPPETLRLLAHSIACNSKASMGVDGKTGRPIVIGNKTEGAMLNFIRSLGFNYLPIREKNEMVKTYPFSSAKKRMTTVVRDPDSGKLSLYCKGAPERLLVNCSKYLAPDGSQQALNDDGRKRITQSITAMASKGLRTLAVACKELAETTPIPAIEAGAESLEEEMVLLCVLGIEDPLRKEVPRAVEECQMAGIIVRMVTGDNVLTAKNIAKKCGILTDGGEAIEGPVFAAMSEAEQIAILPKLQVLARCSPMDKLTLVKRLKQTGEVVAVTGDGTNDAPALKEADVGLSMGILGTAVAQEASDIVIMDDNFSSIVKAVMWGRSVYDNIRRFLQFQLTVNVVALFICTVGAITGFGTPLKPIQLLWVNLIMDTFGALALATEPPTPDLLQRMPYGRNDQLVNAHMWRNILIQSVYQIATQMFLLVSGAEFLFDCSEVHGEPAGCIPLKPNGQGKNLEGNYRDTVIYNSFVLCQLFNEINSRRIYNEKNMFEGIFSNSIFVGIVVASMLFQVFTVEFGGTVFRTVKLDVYAWGICLAIGAFSLILGVFQRTVPASWFGAVSPGGPDSVSARRPVVRAEDDESGL